jgi:hypothetical protein
MKRRRLLFAAVPLLALVGLWEVAARVAGVAACQAPTPSTGSWAEMQADPRFLWRLTPGFTVPSSEGTTVISELGLRDSFVPAPKGEHEVRILTTGDSSVYGWGVPPGRTFQELLEARLALTWPDTRFEVINLGVPGYSTVQSMRLLDDVGWSLQPDLVIVGNIFSDCNIDTFQDERALALIHPETSGAHRVLEHSRTYCAAWNTYASWYATSNQERNRVLMPGVPRDTRWLEKVDLFVDLSRVPLGDYVRNLETIRASAASHGSGMLLMPLAQEWDVGRWTVDHLPKPTEGQVLPWHTYRAAMAEFAESGGVGLVSMPEAFAATSGNRDRLFSDAVHPSSAGAWVMANALYDWFVAHPDTLGLAAPAAAVPPPPEPASPVITGPRPGSGGPPGPPPGSQQPGGPQGPPLDGGAQPGPPSAGGASGPASGPPSAGGPPGPAGGPPPSGMPGPPPSPSPGR